MHTLLFIFTQIPIGVISWIDLTGLIATITLIVYIYRFARSRVTKNDMDIALEKKASKKMVVSEFEKQNLKITHVEEMSMVQDKYINDSLAEQYAILETVQNDIKTILGKI